MRLGACALVIASCLALAPTPAQAAKPAVEVVTASIAEISEAGEAILQAHDPEGENADRIEELVAEAFEQLDLMAGRIAPAVNAAARVRCHRPDATLDQSVAEYDAAIGHYEDAYQAVMEAYELSQQSNNSRT